MRSAYFALNLRFGNPDRFDSELASWSLGSVSLSRLCSGALPYRRLKKHLASDCDEQLLITMPARSEVYFPRCGNEVRCRPGSYILERSHGESADLWVLKIETKALGQWIRDMRLKAAREDLHATHNPLSIAEICYRRGFSDHAYLSRLFKAQFGLSPRGYRQQVPADQPRTTSSAASATASRCPSL